MIPPETFSDAAFLGFSKKSVLAEKIKARNKDYFDLCPEDDFVTKWDINKKEWNINKKYDLIVCTRCAYFAKDPERFIDQCYEILNPGGYILVDWAIGDHWRFDNYKIGWVKDSEHEYAYADNNFLWSCLWDDYFLNDLDFVNFSENVKKFGYNDVKKAIFDEIPSIISLSYIFKFFDVQYSMISLWPDKPQLYTILVCRKRIE